jgi:3-methylfumaryl-CoA hydratase
MAESIGAIIEELQDWVGREERAADIAEWGPVARLAAILDYEHPPWPAHELPALAHWLYFLPRDQQSALDPDGHPRRGAFLPPVPLPRRMWAGSRVQFLTSVSVGASLERRSTIARVTCKSGTAGNNVFVTVKHEIASHGAIAIIEEQDLVYLPALAAQSGSARPVIARDPRVADVTRSMTADPVRLFRYSALTFNAHRIHYDREYARMAEGYPGLVVHGPLLAILALDHFRREAEGAVPRSFQFRAHRPLFDTDRFDVCLAWNAAGASLWIVNTAGAVMLSASVERA